MSLSKSDWVFFTTSFAIAVALSCHFILSRWRTSKSDVQYLPRASGGHWLWGHEREVFDHPAGAKYTEWFNNCGPIFRMKGAFFTRDQIVAADPRFIHYVLTDNAYNYVKSPVLRPLIERLVGRGLIWAEGDLHKQQRKLLNTTFSSRNIRDMCEEVFEPIKVLQARLSRHVQDNNGDVVINAVPWSSAATLDVIGRVGFNHDFQSGQTEDAKEIQSAWWEQISLGMTRAAFIGQITLRSFPFLLSLPVKAIQAQGRIKVVVDGLSRRLLEKGFDNDNGHNLLSMLMKINASDDDKMSKNQMIDHITSFIIAGQETTAGAVSMTLYELAKHPSIQQRLRNEVTSLGREPTYDDFTNSAILPYLDAVIKEALRIHPPGPYMDRETLEDDVIPLGTPICTPSGELLHELHIRAGQIPNISINRIDSVWKDGNVFRPERWIEPLGLPPRDMLQNGWSNIMSFSEGPRLCVGYRLALLEYKAILAMLIRNFVFHDTHADVELKFSTTLQPRVVGREDEGVQLPLRVTLTS